MGLKIGMISPWGKNVRCGIRTYTENLVYALAELGVDVYIIRMPRIGMKTQEIIQNVVDSIPLDKVDLINVQNEFGLFQNFDYQFYQSLSRIGKPIISMLHAVGSWIHEQPACMASDKIIVHNKWCMDNLSCQSKATIIPHGCKPSQPMPKEEARRLLGIPLEANLVGYLGFISPNKGLEHLIEALIPLKDVALLIGGGWHVDVETQYIEDLKRRTLELLPSRCLWLGYVDDDRLPAFYGAVDLIVYPPRFATESGALLTALSYGKAVIASNLPPFKEKGQALITFEDVEDLREKIRHALDDDEFRNKLEEGARKFAYENRWEVVAEKHLELYKELLNRN
jgi:glycosyltransferase involved in cell wall biosynthesis